MSIVAQKITYTVDDKLHSSHVRQVGKLVEPDAGIDTGIEA